MKIYIPNESRQSIGGGWTFLRNIVKYFGDEMVHTPDDADIIFIVGATMFKGRELEDWKKQGKKIVLRVDNIPKDSRNRGCGVSRLAKCAEYADLVIYQSIWSKKYAGQITKKDGPVIYNGADTDIFYKRDLLYEVPYINYLFIKDKDFDRARYRFMELYKEDEQRELHIVGRFDQKLIEYNFDFFNGEQVQYYGQITDPHAMADLMRQCQVLLFPAFADSCPQTVVEAMNCGLDIQMVDQVGGTRELLNIPLEELSLEYMGNQYRREFEQL